MTERAWKDRAEMIGIFAIVASLIFVGGELRQNAIATRAAMNAEIAVSFVDLNLVVASSPELTQRLADFAENPAAAPRQPQKVIKMQMSSVGRDS